MKFMFFSIAIFYWKTKTSFKPFGLLQSHLLLCKQGFCDVSVTLYKVSVTLSPALERFMRALYAWGGGGGGGGALRRHYDRNSSITRVF